MVKYIVLLLILSITACTPEQPTSETIIPLTFEAIAPTEHDEFAPAISPDGRFVAFVGHHEGNPQIYLFDTLDRTVTNPLPSSHDRFAPEWSPDGLYLWFKDRPTAYKYPQEIFMLDMETGEQLPVTITIERYGVYYYAWDNNNNTISYLVGTARPYSNFLVRDGDSFQGVGQPNFINGEPYHTIDATLSFEGFRQSPQSMIANFVPIDGDDNYHNIRYYEWSASGEHFVWSFDTTRIDEFQFPPETINEPILEDRHISVNTDLFVTNQDGDSDLLIQLEHEILMGAWSPIDSQVFAFSTYRGLYIANIETGEVSNILYNHGHIRDLQWSPNGEMIATIHYAKENAPLIPAELIITPISDASTHYSYSYVVDDFKFWQSPRTDRSRYPYRELQWFPDSDRLLLVYAVQHRYDIGLLSIPSTDSE